MSAQENNLNTKVGECQNILNERLSVIKESFIKEQKESKSIIQE